MFELKLFFHKLVRFSLFVLFISMKQYNKTELEKLILEQNKTYSDIGKLYGVSGAAIKKAAIKLEIKLPIRRKINENENFSHKRQSTKSLVNIPSNEEFKSIIETSFSWKEIGEKLGYKSKVLASNVKESIKKRCETLNIILNIIKQDDISNVTKGELFKCRKNWQSARTAIQKLARTTFFNNNKSPKCHICGYDKHVEVAHIKAVSEFDDTATVNEINSVNNLIGLCPNHHWEYDHGLLTI